MSDAALYLRVVFSLLFVLGLIGAFVWVARKYGAAGFGAARGDRRLAVVESLPLDTKRRLVLVRRDGALHLLLLGGQNDLVVEAGIGSPAAAMPAAPPSANDFPDFLRRPADSPGMQPRPGTGRQIGLGEVKL